MIRSQLYDPTTGQQTEGGRELLDEWRQSSQAILWADFYQAPTEEEASILTQYFGIHPLAIQDAQRDRHPPKFESFQNCSFILLKGLDAETTDLEFGTIQIAIFIGERFLVTRHSGVSPSIAQLWQRTKTDPALLALGPDATAIRLADIVVTRYLPILLAVESRLDDLEDDIVRQPSDTLLAELVGHKTSLKKLRRIITYHVQLFETIRATTPPGIRPALKHEINDVYEHLERTMSLTNLYHDLAADLVDGYISMASHRLNQIMKILTIITAIFVPLSFMAGLYGMNFENMPELRSPHGYFVLLGVMAATAIGLLLLFRRKGWL